MFRPLDIMYSKCRMNFARKRGIVERQFQVMLAVSRGLLCVTSHLKTPHVSRVPCILQAVLVTLQEELEEKPAHTHTDRETERCEKRAAVCRR